MAHPFPVGTRVRYRSGIDEILVDGKVVVVGHDKVGVVAAEGEYVCFVLHNSGGFQLARTDEMVVTDLPLTGARENLPTIFGGPKKTSDAHQIVRAALGERHADLLGLEPVIDSRSPGAELPF